MLRVFITFLILFFFPYVTTLSKRPQRPSLLLLAVPCAAARNVVAAGFILQLYLFLFLFSHDIYLFVSLTKCRFSYYSNKHEDVRRPAHVQRSHTYLYCSTSSIRSYASVNSCTRRTQQTILLQYKRGLNRRDTELIFHVRLIVVFFIDSRGTRIPLITPVSYIYVLSCSVFVIITVITIYVHPRV